MIFLNVFIKQNCIFFYYYLIIEIIYLIWCTDSYRKLYKFILIQNLIKSLCIIQLISSSQLVFIDGSVASVNNGRRASALTVTHVPLLFYSDHTEKYCFNLFSDFMYIVRFFGVNLFFSSAINLYNTIDFIGTYLWCPFLIRSYTDRVWKQNTIKRLRITGSYKQTNRQTPVVDIILYYVKMV